MKSNLKKYRKEAGLTLQQLGDKVGFCRSHIHKIENGGCAVSLEAAYKISNVLRKKVQDVWPNAVDWW